MKDYKTVETDYTNKVALSLQPGRDNNVEFLETCNASDRFLHLAKAISDAGILGWQISADRHGKFSNVLFTSAGVTATADDYNWIFKNCAISKPDQVSLLKNLYDEHWKVYMLYFNPERIEHYELPDDELYGFFDDNYQAYPNRHFIELIEMLAETGAVIQMIADSPEENNLISLCLPDEISLRLRGMISMAIPYVEIEDTDYLPDSDTKYISNKLFQIIMSNMLYALIHKSEKEAEPADLYRQEEITAAISEVSNEMSSIQKASVLEKKSIEEKERASYYQKNPSFEKFSSLQVSSYYDMLEELIGLNEAKQQIRKIIAFARMERDILASGGKQMPVAINMEFIGNPGTAKTTVARISAGIFHEIGLLSSEEMIEVGRADLIGKYEGQTATKVKDEFLKAKGKMLFIDEAYSLVECWDGGYGDEAINTIVQEMENNRNDTIVVFAGYPDKMKVLFDRNPGLRSRIPFTVRFEDYSTEEMVEIAEFEAKKRGFNISAEAARKVREICNMATGNNEAGNGRLCRNLVEAAILEYALRTYDEIKDPTFKDYVLGAEDFSIPNHLKELSKTSRIGFVIE